MKPYPSRILLAVLLLNASACSAKSPASLCADLQGPAEQRHQIEHDGVSREYLVHLPPKRAEKMPVVIALHGGKGTAKGFKKRIGMDDEADRQGFIAVYPQGLDNTWNAGECCGKARRKNRDDSGFIAALSTKINNQYCADRNRVNVAGNSAGGMLAYRLACEHPDKITAIAAVSAAPVHGACQRERFVPTLIIRGTEDSQMPWDGGMVTRSWRPPVSETVEQLDSEGQCSPAKPFYEKGAAFCDSRASCNGEGELALCSVRGGGHVWPGIRAAKLARQGGDVNLDLPATKIIWEFFARQPPLTD